MSNEVLSKRHRRLLSSLLFVLEQKIEDIEHVLNHSPENASYSIDQDLTSQQKEYLASICIELKKVMKHVVDKLDLKKRKFSQAQYISTIQSQMWENISDAFSDKLKGYGKKVVSDAKETDPYIQMISDQIDKLKI